MEGNNVVLCAVWVPRGEANPNPEKVEITVDELKDLMKQSNLMETDNGGEEDTGNREDTIEDKENSTDADKQEDKDEMDVDEEVKEEDENENEEDFDKLYGFQNYENEAPGVADLKGLLVYADQTEDPLVDRPERDEDEESEAENHAIQPQDNLIAVGRYNNGESVLEVYVYNAETNSLYCHHDNLLPEAPLCMEWLNFNPKEENTRGNLVAVGIMSPIIQVWDLDLIDGQEPAFELDLRSIPRVEKYLDNMEKLAKQGKEAELFGVLSIAWNKDNPHILASGDSCGATVWDLEDSDNWRSIVGFDEPVQCLQWHEKNSSILLAATTVPQASDSSKGSFYMIDCATTDETIHAHANNKVWTFKGGIESFQCVSESRFLISSSYTVHKKKGVRKGILHCIDINHSAPIWSFEPHKTASSALLSKQCPGLLLTGGEDKIIRVWDTLHEKSKDLSNPPELVSELKPNVGEIFALKHSPEIPYVFAIGGNNKSNSFRVWDITTSKKVRDVFFPRKGLPVEGNTVDEEQLQVEEEEEDEQTAALKELSVAPLPSKALGGVAKKKKRKNRKNKVKRLQD